MRKFLVTLVGSGMAICPMDAQMVPHWIWASWNEQSLGLGRFPHQRTVELGWHSRFQWTGFPGAPITHTVTVMVPVPWRDLQAGGRVLYDRIGPMQRTSILGNVLLPLRAPERSSVQFQPVLGMDISSWILETCALTLPGGASPCEIQDPAFPSTQSRSRWTVSFLAGLRADHLNEGWSAGVVVLLLPRWVISFSDGTSMTHPPVLFAFFRLPEGMEVQEWKVGGAFQFYSTYSGIWQSQIQIYASRNILQFGMGTVGYTGTTFESIYLLLGYTPSRWKDRLWFAYAYGLPVGRISRWSVGTHEIAVRYSLPVRWMIRISPIIDSPRLL